MTELCSCILLLVRERSDLDRMLGTANWLARRAGGTLRILTYAEDSRRAEEIDQGIMEMAPGRYRLDREESAGDLKREVLTRAEQLGATLLMVSIDLEKMAKSTKRQQEVLTGLEESSIPVLVIPKDYRQRIPWRSILVPMSGERREDRALQYSIELSNILDIPVDIFHVRDPEAKEPSLISHFSGEPQHEFPEMLEEFIAEASPMSSAEEKRNIREFPFIRGRPRQVVLDQVRKSSCDLIAVQWFGTFTGGRARILKGILSESKAAVLVTKVQRQNELYLRAGRNIA